MSSFTELELDVVRLAEARKIFPNGKPLEQAKRVKESAVDLYGALIDSNTTDATYAIGDLAISLITVCALLDVNLTDCLEKSYKEIKNA